MLMKLLHAGEQINRKSIMPVPYRNMLQTCFVSRHSIVVKVEFHIVQFVFWVHVPFLNICLEIELIFETNHVGLCKITIKYMDIVVSENAK